MTCSHRTPEDQRCLLCAALSRAEQRIGELEHALATAIPEDMAMRNQELIIKFITAERERDEARKAHSDLCAAISRAIRG